MEYEKFENSDIELKKQQYNPYRLISSIAETQALTLDVTKQAIEITGSQNIEIYLDRDLFTQLTYNLI
jgi:hypothetical protein